MSTVSKDALRRMIDELSENDIQALLAALNSRDAPASPLNTSRPLKSSDIIRTEPVLPDDETADELIATVRRWRREGGYA